MSSATYVPDRPPPPAPPEPDLVWVECPTCRTVWQANSYETWDGYERGREITNDECTNPDCDGADGNTGEEIRCTTYHKQTTI